MFSSSYVNKKKTTSSSLLIITIEKIEEKRNDTFIG